MLDAGLDLFKPLHGGLGPPLGSAGWGGEDRPAGDEHHRDQQGVAHAGGAGGAGAPTQGTSWHTTDLIEAAREKHQASGQERYRRLADQYVDELELPEGRTQVQGDRRTEDRQPENGE